MAVFSEYGFESADDVHTRIHGVKWECESGEPLAALMLVHGMQEHIERYDEFARFLADRGFVVMGHDHIGHGESVEDESGLGIMHCAYPDDVMVEDMFTNYKIMRKQYPGRPYFILGHSMGSYLLRKFLCVRSSDLGDLNGAIIMGTGTENDAAIVAGRTLCRILMAFHGRDAKSDAIKGLMFGSRYYRQFDTTGADPANSWLSKNIDNVREYMDPANRKDCCDFSLNGYMILLRATQFDNSMKNIRRMNMDIPILFVSGDMDPVGAMGEGVKKAHEKFAKAGVKDLSIKLYHNDRHEILNELDRESVYSDLYEWMKDRLEFQPVGK